MKVTYLLGFVSIFIKLNTIHGDRPCLQKSYGKNKIVCVCNVDYCDYLTMPPLKSNEYLMFTSTAQGDRFKMQLGLLSTISSTHGSHAEKIPGLLSTKDTSTIHVGHLKTTSELRRTAAHGFKNLPTKLNARYTSSAADVGNYETKSEVMSSFPHLHLTSTVKLSAHPGMASVSIRWLPKHIKVMVDPKKRYQSIMGFDGALTDAAVLNYRSLLLPAQANLAHSYFNESGIGYNMIRVPIGSTDFSPEFYTYDDSSEPDPNLNKFHLRNPEDTLFRIPALKMFQELNPNIKLFATAWTSPGWMKFNVTRRGPYFLKSKYYQTWANYYLKFLQAYKEEGLNIWGLTTGNNPTSSVLSYNKKCSLAFLPHQMGNFIGNHLGPTLRKSEFSSIKLMTIDDEIFDFPTYLWGIYLANWKAKQYVDGYALHWYWNGILPYQLLSFTRRMYPNQFILSTEASEGYRDHKVKLGDWNRAQAYALDIIKDMRNWVTGWVDWNMALNTYGSFSGPSVIKNHLDAPIIINGATEFYKQPMFYAIGHFSKFVPRNSTRIGLRYPFLSGLDMVGFQKPDGSYVIVIMNRRSTEKNVTLMDGSGRGMSQIILPKSINTILFA